MPSQRSAGSFISRLAGGLKVHLLLGWFIQPLITALFDAGGDVEFARELIRHRLEQDGLGFFSRLVNERALSSLGPSPVTSDGMHGAGDGTGTSLNTARGEQPGRGPVNDKPTLDTCQASPAPSGVGR